VQRTSIVLLACAAMTVSIASADSPGPPPWAFAIDPAWDQPVPAGGPLLHVPNSKAGYTRAQIANGFAVPDWHPSDHPPMPPVVAHGRKPNILACGYCHLPTGLGRPENASLAGLPTSYIAQQIGDFKSGARKSAEPRGEPISFMIKIAHALAGPEIKVAADYFSALKRTPWIRVVETDSVPKTKVAEWMLMPVGDGATEPIGQRIIEVPENVELTRLRDTASGFVAYVPVGSIKKGEDLVTTGAGKTTPCGICHGQDLRGLGPMPPLAGRSPSYLVRQLYDMQHGFRAGPSVALMMPVVAKLTPEDIVDIVAYASSRAP
jgi:cytochrome c553